MQSFIYYEQAANGVCFPESFQCGARSITTSEPGRTVVSGLASSAQCTSKLARDLLQQDGWKLQIVKRRQRAFKITGLTWIVERSFAWLGRNRRLSKDHEYNVQTSETLIDIAATGLILNRLASA